MSLPAQVPPKYEYTYDVSDDYRKVKFDKTESRDGYKTAGSYSVNLPDGRKQIVTYADNGDGLLAEVKYEGEIVVEPYPAHPPVYPVEPYFPAYHPAPAYPRYPTYPAPPTPVEVPEEAAPAVAKLVEEASPVVQLVEEAPAEEPVIEENTPAEEVAPVEAADEGNLVQDDEAATEAAEPVTEATEA